MGVDGPHRAAGHLQNTPKACLPLVAAGSQSALYVLYLGSLSREVCSGKMVDHVVGIMIGGAEIEDMKQMVKI